jgi:hypothetical protein
MLALLLACQHSDTKPAEKEQPLPYIYEEDTLPDASVDPAAVEAAAVAGLSRAMALRAGPVFPAYHAVMSTADGGCPNYYDYNGSVYWYDNCYSEMGTDYSGYSFYTLYDKVDDGAGDVYSGEAL